MPNLPLTLPRETVMQRIRRSALWWRWRARLARAGRAWRYATGTMNADDAQSITTDCRYLAGWHPLVILSTESTLDFAHDVYEDHPELARLVADACDRVGDKWDDYSESASAAQDWAMEKVAEYAAMEGIKLVKREGWEV